MPTNRQIAQALAAGCLAAVIGMAPAVSTAQEKATVSSSESVSAKVTVKSVDHAARTVVVTRDTGEVVSLKVPAEARNFENLKPGDTISITYTLATAYVLSAPNTALPSNAVGQIEARTPQGARPGGVVANRIVVTGAVVAVDQAKHTLTLVSPQGGAVQTVAVSSDKGRRAMPKIKVGDTITAYITESVLLTVEPL